MSQPCEVYVLANPECPHCVHAVDNVTEWAIEDGIPISGVDVRRHPEYEARWSLETSPVIVFKRGEREEVRVGMVDHDEFRRLAHAR